MQPPAVKAEPFGRKTVEDHASYIANWIKVLKGDKRAIFSATSHAQRAVDFIQGKQPTTQAIAA